MATRFGVPLADRRGLYDIEKMQIFLDHIGYIGITLLAGMAIGWKTYPLYRALIDRIHGTDRGYQREYLRRR